MIEIKLARGIRSCNNCDAINYKSSISYNAKIVERMYELRIGYTVLCLCEDCFRKVCSFIDVVEKGGAE